MAFELLRAGRGGQVLQTTMYFLVPVTALGLALAGPLQAQNDTNKSDPPNQQKTVTVAGCLTQSETAGIAIQYVLKSADLSYPLDPGAEDLDAHLGHKVRISGTSMKGKGPHDQDRIRVTKVTMISATCLP
jgi:hypothetical protein